MDFHKKSKICLVDMFAENKKTGNNAGPFYSLLP